MEPLLCCLHGWRQKFDQKDCTMATKTDFSTEEWKEVLASVMMAGMAVTLADPSGLIGLTKEGLASGSALLAAKNDANANALVKAVVADFETSEGRSAAREAIKTSVAGKQPAEMKTSLLEALGRVGSILDAKAAADASAFKARLAQVSERVAEAAGEGGFLGFGGVRVSDAEKATLDDISKALRLSA
jgi:hypothetical protein